MIHCQKNKNIECPKDINFLHNKKFSGRAGIIPFIIDGRKNTYILLGKDKTSGNWSDLGGRSEDNETVLENAYREFLEESRSVLEINLKNITLTKNFNKHFLKTNMKMK